MLVFLYIGQDVDFVDCALFEFFVLFESANFYDFYSVFLIVVFVDSSIDLTVCSFSDDFVESVVLNDSHHEN